MAEGRVLGLKDRWDAEVVAIDEHLDLIVEAAKKIGRQPLRILDLATGRNSFNPLVVGALQKEGIDYELVLTDVSPTHFENGYLNVRQVLEDDEVDKVKCVLADIRNLDAELVLVPLWGEGEAYIVNAVKLYPFLEDSYDNGRRIVGFEDESFDMVIGCIPYSSINTDFSGKDYHDAIAESARVLREGGFHIVEEMQVARMNNVMQRTPEALKRVFIKYVDNIVEALNDVLDPVKIVSRFYPYPTEEKNPEQTLQNGDLVQNSIIVHRKDYK